MALLSLGPTSGSGIVEPPSSSSNSQITVIHLNRPAPIPTVADRPPKPREKSPKLPREQSARADDKPRLEPEPDANAPGSGAYFPAASDRRIGTRLARYRVVAVLGRGGMGTVYEAYDELAGRSVALKILPDQLSQDIKAAKRFLLGARAAARLEHRNLVGIYEADVCDGVFYVAMPLVRGQTAQEFLHKHGPLAWPTATRIAAAVCNGLRAAHAVGVIHRDIKPSNLIITRDGVVKLADFGLARTSDLPGSTTGAALVGTVAYMSPEQCRGQRVDARSDLYGLGATYFRLLTGRSPYSGHLWGVIHAHCHMPLPDPRQLRADLPGRCSRIVARAMAKSPDERYQTASEMLADLVTALRRNSTVPPAK